MQALMLFLLVLAVDEATQAEKMCEEYEQDEADRDSARWMYGG